MSARTVAVVVVVLGLGIGLGLLVGDGDEATPTASTTSTTSTVPSTTPTVPVEPPAPFPTGMAFAEPPVVTSVGETLSTTITARNVGSVDVGGVPVGSTQTYAAGASGETKRGILGPTLQVDPGDTIDIMFDNQLVIPSAVPGPNCPDTGKPADDSKGHAHGGKAGDPQYTNLHFHGLHVTPRRVSPYGDSVLVHLPAGKSHIKFKIPSDHDEGTFWYHAHLHECTTDQVTRGLAGMLLVGDSRHNIMPQASYASITTRLLALKDVQLERQNGSPQWRIPGKDAIDWSQPTHRTVNGLVNPRLDIRPRETQLWRLANVSAGVWYQVALVNESQNDAKEPLIVVAQDGNSLTQPKLLPSILMPPGSRFDVLVVGPESGTRRLKTEPFKQGRAWFPEDALATLVVSGAAALPLAPPTGLAKPSQQFPASKGKTRRFTFDFGLITPTTFQAQINDMQFDPDVADASPTLATTERWIIYNKTNEWHPFHIHQDDFRVVDSGGGPERLPGAVQDVVPLPPGTPEKPSKVEIDMPFTDYEGQFVFHCHILDHEDAGMMSLVDLRRDWPSGG